MIFNLVKKDFILLKKYWLFLVAFQVIAPIFISNSINLNDNGFLSFFITVIFSQYMLFGTVSRLEDKYNGDMLLSATPYKRSELVKSKYMFLFIIFLITYIIYTLIVLIAPLNMEFLNIFTLGLSLLITTVYFSISIPLQYKYGFEKLKYISSMIIFIVPFSFPYILNWFQSNKFNIYGVVNLPEVAKNFIIYSLIIIITVISINISIKIYSKKDLV